MGLWAQLCLRVHPTTLTGTQYALSGLRHIKTCVFASDLQLLRKNCKIALIHISSKLLSSNVRYMQRSPESSVKQKSQRWAWLTHPYSFLRSKHCIFQRGKKLCKICVIQSSDAEGGRVKAVPQEEKKKHPCITNILLSVQGGMSKHILDNGYWNTDSSESRGEGCNITPGRFVWLKTKLLSLCEIY